MGKLTIKVHEAKDDKFVPYTMMQYYVPEEKKWDPIIVEPRRSLRRARRGSTPRRHVWKTAASSCRPKCR